MSKSVFAVVAIDDGNPFVTVRIIRNVSDLFPPPKKIHPDLSDIRPGKVFYLVHSLDFGSYMNKIEILENPYLTNNSCFVKVKITYRDSNWDFSSYASECSLKDMNVIPNTYNKHKLFFDKKDAEKYLVECIKGYFKSGRTVYIVSALGSQTYIEEKRICSVFSDKLVFRNTYGGYDCAYFDDFNLPENDYNYHRIFLNKYAAESYKRVCVQRNYTVPLMYRKDS